MHLSSILTSQVNCALFSNVTWTIGLLVGLSATFPSAIIIPLLWASDPALLTCPVLAGLIRLEAEDIDCFFCPSFMDEALVYTMGEYIYQIDSYKVA